MSAPIPSMLYLRRHVGEKIYIFDSEVELEVVVREIVTDAGELRSGVRLRIVGEKRDRVLRKGDIQSILQGDGKIRLSAIQTFRNGDPYANIGIAAPRTMKILRGEMLAGTSREERANMT